MRFDSGELEIYRASIVHENGGMPTEGYASLGVEAYGERKVGIQRHYLAKEHDEEVDLLVRIHRRYDITVNDLVVLRPYTHTDGAAYKVLQIQNADDDEPCTDLALQREVGLDASSIENGTN